MTEKLPTTKEGWDERTRKNREKRAEEKRERREAAEKRAAEHAWKKAGNDPKDFEAAYPEIRHRRQIERLEGEGGRDSQVEAHRQMLRNAF